MDSILETVGSFIIGGMIILIVISFNLNMNTNSIEDIQNSFTLSNSVVNASIFDYDLYKIGYRVNSNRIVKADSTGISFAADMDNNSSIDSVEYKTGATSDLISTKNTMDKPLLRRMNSSTFHTVGVVTNFLLSYYDSLGNKISYANLAYQTNRDLIRTIKIEATFESYEPTDTTYSGLNWTKTIRPKNLR